MKITQVFMKKQKTHEFKYFKRWIEREMYGDQVRATFHPLVGSRFIKKQNWHYEEHRPWSEQFKRQNAPGQRHKKYYVEPVKDYMIYKGDRVEILAGKDKGKHGLVTTIIKERNWCFIDSLNCEYEMIQQSPDTPPKCKREERPLLITSQVKLVDPADEQGCDVEWRYSDDGEKLRVSTRTGRTIPIPATAAELENGVHPDNYIDNKDTDTPEKIVKEVTFKPKILTFDEEILESMNIKEDRKPAKTYWY